VLDRNRTLQLVKVAWFDRQTTWRNGLPDACDWRRTAILLTGPLILAANIADAIGLLGGEVSIFGSFSPTIGFTLLN
jgi:hypothetical protein